MKRNDSLDRNMYSNWIEQKKWKQVLSSLILYWKEIWSFQQNSNLLILPQQNWYSYSKTNTSTAKSELSAIFLKTTDPPSINVQEKWPRRSYACKSTVDPNCQLNRSEHKCTAYITILVLLHSLRLNVTRTRSTNTYDIYNNMFYYIIIN